MPDVFGWKKASWYLSALHKGDIKNFIAYTYSCPDFLGEGNWKTYQNIIVVNGYIKFTCSMCTLHPTQEPKRNEKSTC